MKRVLTLLATTAMFLALLVGCGGTNDPAATPDAQTPPANPSETAAPPDPEASAPVISEYFADLGVSPHVSPYTGEKILRETHSSMSTFSPHMYANDLHIFGGLTIWMAARDRSGVEEMIPYHAKSLPLSTDGGYTWEIEIREGLTWSDGKTLDANDYYYSMKQLLNPSLANINAGRLYKTICVVNAEEYFKGNCEWDEVGIKLVDDHHLEIRLEYPVSNNVFWVSIRLLWPVYPEIYEAGMNEDGTATTYGTTLEETPSCGYFILTEWDLDDHYSYVKNENDPLVQAGYIIIDKVYSRCISGSSTAIEEMFNNGEIDYMGLSMANYETYKNDPRIYPVQSVHMWGMFVNSASENTALRDINLRKALYFGTPQELLVSSTNPTYGASSTMLSRKLTIVWDDGTQTPYRQTAEGRSIEEKYHYDEELAKEYFEKAYENIGEEKITINIIYSETSSAQKRIAEILQQMWPEMFGTGRIEVTLSSMPQTNAYDVYRSGNYDLGFGFRNANSTVLADSLAYYASNYSDKYITGFQNNDFDELYRRCVYGDLTMDPQGTAEALACMEDLLLDYVAFIPVYQNDAIYMYQDWIHLVTETPGPKTAYSVYQCDINPSH